MLEGLGTEAAAQLLAASAPAATDPVREWLLAEAAGNPLALLELPSGLSAAQLQGRAALPETTPLTSRLRSAFVQRIDRLPAETRTALLIAAVDDSGEVAAVVGAAGEAGLPEDALDSAERAGLLRVVGGRIVFRHPLVRSALLESSTHSQRRGAHAALAAALSGDEHADRRAWHQALATLTTDEEVAAALEASARRYRGARRTRLGRHGVRPRGRTECRRGPPNPPARRRRRGGVGRRAARARPRADRASAPTHDRSGAGGALAPARRDRGENG